MTERTEAPFFTEETSAEVVIARNADAPDARLAEIMAVLTRHLHAAVKEIEPTPEEWMAAIRFLTETGQMCDDLRQEYILLSDVLGVSMLVDVLNSRRPAGATENTVLGPFHVDGAPARENGDSICLDGKGTPLLVAGRVTDVATGDPIAGAVLDVWQANDDGFYDVQQQETQPAHNLRGVFKTDAVGRYHFRSCKPTAYCIPSDGPVGKLLAALGRAPWRPAHLHVICEAPGYDRVVTHVFDPEDPHLESDAVFGVKRSLLGDFQTVDDPAAAQAHGLPNPFEQLTFDLALVARP